MIHYSTSAKGSRRLPRPAPPRRSTSPGRGHRRRRDARQRAAGDPPGGPPEPDRLLSGLVPGRLAQRAAPSDGHRALPRAHDVQAQPQPTAHPYGSPIIGWQEDIARITPEEIRAFYRTYYVPNNAMVVAVGDFRAGEVLERIKRRFGGIPRGAAPPPVLTVEPPPNGERRVVVRKQAELPIVYLAYHVPNQRSNDAAPLEVLSTILSGGRASRLYRYLVYERRLALEAGGDYSYFSIDPNLFWFWATAMPGQTPETLEKELLAQVERLKTEPVTDEELRRAKNQIEAAFVFQEDSIHRRASLLARFEVIGGYAQKD